MGHLKLNQVLLMLLFFIVLSEFILKFSLPSVSSDYSSGLIAVGGAGIFFFS